MDHQAVLERLRRQPLQCPAACEGRRSLLVLHASHRAEGGAARRDAEKAIPSPISPQSGHGDPGLQVTGPPHGLRAQQLGQRVDRGLAAGVAALPQTPQHFQGSSAAAPPAASPAVMDRADTAVASSAGGSPGQAGSRPILRIVRTDTRVSSAIRSCGTPAASSNWTSRRFASPNMYASRSWESPRGLHEREDRDLGLGRTGQDFRSRQRVSFSARLASATSGIVRDRHSKTTLDELGLRPPDRVDQKFTTPRAVQLDSVSCVRAVRLGLS